MYTYLKLHFQIAIIASRPIAKNEEITICYGPEVPNSCRQERQEFLVIQYGFWCHCKACECDDTKTIQNVMQKFLNWRNQALNSEEIKEHVLKGECKEKYEKELKLLKEMFKDLSRPERHFMGKIIQCRLKGFLYQYYYGKAILNDK